MALGAERPLRRSMHCWPSLVLSALLVALGLLLLWLHLHRPVCYGKHELQQRHDEERKDGAGADRAEKPPPPRRACLPARYAWFLQELPALLVPALLLALRSPPRLAPLGCRLLVGMFCGHYFHSTALKAQSVGQKEWQYQDEAIVFLKQTVALRHEKPHPSPVIN
ncbi:3-oxo-5-alpha-steroid 4-dehydrogenase 2 [Varanus komodoensis]|nr:3-oxo-5-alpha-steroid 4-dehydrogenase 2 [Varanus komodoensis]